MAFIYCWAVKAVHSSRFSISHSNSTSNLYESCQVNASYLPADMPRMPKSDRRALLMVMGQMGSRKRLTLPCLILVPLPPYLCLPPSIKKPARLRLPLKVDQCASTQWRALPYRAQLHPAPRANPTQPLALKRRRMFLYRFLPLPAVALDAEAGNLLITRMPRVKVSR